VDGVINSIFLLLTYWLIVLKTAKIIFFKVYATWIRQNWWFWYNFDWKCFINDKFWCGIF